MSSVAEESFTNISTVKAFSNESFEIEKFKRMSQKVYQGGRTRTIYRATYSLI